MINHGDWIDKIDRDIIPFVEYPGYENRYPTIEPIQLTNSLLQEVTDASRFLFYAFRDTTRVFQDCGNEFMKDMDIPEKLIPYLNLKEQNVMQMPTWLSRFDFVLDKDMHPHMVEINADTPCAVVEAFYGNGIAATELGYPNVNVNSYYELRSYFKRIILATEVMKFKKNGSISTDAPFVFACFDDYVEDKGTTMYLMNVMKDAASSLFPDAKDLVCFVSLYDLRIDDDGVVLPDGRHAGAIYRLHPMELLIEEIAEDGTDLGVYMLEGYKHGKFAMMNPPEAIIMQSKGFQALITQKECKAVLSESQREAVEKYMLPTFFERDFVPEKESRWIKKPIWGREGNGIKLLDHHGNLIDEKYIENPEEIVQRDSTTCIYQKFIEQPTFKLKTDEGIVDGYITLSVFMLGKEPSAVYARFSPEQIAGTEAYWAPIIGTLE